MTGSHASETGSQATYLPNARCRCHDGARAASTAANCAVSPSNKSRPVAAGAQDAPSGPPPAAPRGTAIARNYSARHALLRVGYPREGTRLTVCERLNDVWVRSRSAPNRLYWNTTCFSIQFMQVLTNLWYSNLQFVTLSS